jgi:RNA polymerase sigma-70 factor, ECF subfamily
VCRIYTPSGPDRDDLYQEIVVQLWHGYQKFRGDSKFSTWVYRVAINTAITGIRRRKDFIKSFEPNDLPSFQHDTPYEEEQLNKLHNAIGKLNDIDKAIVMFYLEDKTYEEMQEIIGISAATLRVKMNRIKEKLRQLTKNNA